ncbi:hypothetical protein [Moorena producens]|uniref:hypothetical protein n=1 Tax=Moorena producens TaxID=1155739 RepID=UPI0013145712|nr:hypothetical protein [Moorena producens]
MQSASVGNHGSCSWGEPPHEGTASPRPHCIALKKNRQTLSPAPEAPLVSCCQNNRI